MKLFFALILLLSINYKSYGNYPFFHFDPSKASISNETFRRYVRPQTKAIIQEFYHLLKKSDPIQGKLINVRTEIHKLREKWETWKIDCKILSQECIGPISSFYKIARKIDGQILAIEKENLSFKDSSQTKKIESLISLSRKLHQISNLNYKLLHLFEEMLITINTNYYYSFSSKELFSPILHEMLVSTEMAMTSLIDKKFAAQFDSLWVEFIKKLEKQILINKNKKFLIKELDELNLEWNSFHMKTIKSNLGFNKNLKSTVTIMHNRWNSILKIILNNIRK